MQNYAYARGSAPPRGPRRDGPAEEGFVSSDPFLLYTHSQSLQLPPLPPHGDRVHSGTQANTGAPNTSNSQILDRGKPTFGVDLAVQMARDNVELPPIMEKCCQAIEKYGMRSQGIYRINGTSRKVAQLKEKLDKGSTSLSGWF
jgi:hypothetical protein